MMSLQHTALSMMAHLEELVNIAIPVEVYQEILLVQTLVRFVVGTGISYINKMTFHCHNCVYTDLC